jgi:hypothetical protein
MKSVLMRIRQVKKQTNLILKRLFNEKRNRLEFSWVSELTPVIDRNFFASIHAYEYAVNLVRNLGDKEKKRLYLLTKRFGNVRNEMGVHWMNCCAQAVKNFDQDTAKVHSMIVLSIIGTEQDLSLGN